LAQQGDAQPTPPPMFVETDPMEGAPDFWADKPRFLQRTARFVRNVWQDQLNYFSWNNAAWIVMGVAAVAPTANTDVDQHFRDWYQDRWANNSGMNSFALDVKVFGAGQYMIPAFVAGGAVSMWLEDYWPYAASPISEWFGRTLR